MLFNLFKRPKVDPINYNEPLLVELLRLPGLFIHQLTDESFLVVIECEHSNNNRSVEKSTLKIKTVVKKNTISIYRHGSEHFKFLIVNTAYSVGEISKEQLIVINIVRFLLSQHSYIVVLRNIHYQESQYTRKLFNLRDKCDEIVRKVEQQQIEKSVESAN